MKEKIRIKLRRQVLPMAIVLGFVLGVAVCFTIGQMAENIEINLLSPRWVGDSVAFLKRLTDIRIIYLAFLTITLFFVLIMVLLLYLKNKRINDYLARQTTTHSTIYAAIPDMIYCKDVNCNYTSCNPSFEKFAGLKEAEIIGKNAIDLFAKRDIQMAEDFMRTDIEAIEAIGASQVKMVEEWCTCPDGSQKLYETVKTPLIQDGVVIGMMGISRDITEHKIAEAAARAASNSKSTFLAHMSHEIRTPMNAIIGMTELVLRDELPKSAYENALSIKQASVDMLAIINDILDFSKIEAGKMEIKPEEYRFDSLINDVISIIRMKMEEKAVFFVVNIDCNIPRRIVGDQIRIRQILLNLLSNAIKFTDEGFISLTVTCELKKNVAVLAFEVADSGIGIKEEDSKRLFKDFVQIDTNKGRNTEGTGLGLTITKSLCNAMNGDIHLKSEFGVGSTFTATIPQQYDQYEKLAEVENPEQKQILVYEPRSIHAHSIIRSIENLGIAYTLAQTQSEFHEGLKHQSYPFIFVAAFLFDGVREVIEDLGTGSKVVLMADLGEVTSVQNIRTIAMPIYSVSIANILNATSVNLHYREKENMNISFIAPTARLLIVDDISTNLRVIEGLLSPYKVQIDACESGPEAIKLVKKNRYDVIFMDHMMPGMDGIQTTSEIRACEDNCDYYKNIPIIAFSANAVAGMKEMFLRNGLNDFLVKPIEVATLNSILEKWIPKEKQEKYVKTKATSILIDPEIEGIDVKVGISMVGGLTEYYIKALAAFYDDGLQKINEIRTCLRDNDIKLYVTHIHALKSASSSIGAIKLSEYAKLLEIASKSGVMAFVIENTERFLNELEVLLQNINVALTETQTEERKMDESDRRLLENRINELKIALENMDAEKINRIINELENKRWDKMTGGIIKKISQRILFFDYHEAIELMNELLKKIGI